MHNPTSILKNEPHKLLCDFDIQTYQLISSRRPGLKIINKRELVKFWSWLSQLITE